MPNPTFELVEQKDGGWEIGLRSPKDFDEVLGRDVLNAFCRCFVHADRLNSAISCRYTSEQHHGRDSMAYGRDVHTLLWFTIGTLRELAIAIRRLRSALKKRHLLDHESEPWVALRKLEERWEDNAFYRKMRDTVAFHVDEEVVNKGLDELSKEPYVALANGQGSKNVNSCLTLGFLALHNGLGMDLHRYGEFVDVVMADHSVAGRAIQESFVLAAEAAGVPTAMEVQRFAAAETSERRPPRAPEKVRGAGVGLRRLVLFSALLMAIAGVMGIVGDSSVLLTALTFICAGWFLAIWARVLRN